ncbi:cytochrome-b5 reductase [Cryptococcus neoformans A2-102-5]|nr:cytochrome-b5 reductase [Cryptococcus neoformans var. grubii A2-102-5]
MAAARFLSSARIARPSVISRTAAQSRGYSSAAPSGGANWPLLLSVAGATGLGAYAYLQYNPSIKKEVEAKVKGVEAEKAAAERTAAGVSAFVKDTWIPFTLEKIEKYNHNANLYHFSFGEEGKDKISGGEVASVVLLRSPEGPDQVKDEKDKPIIRPYTPISPPDQKGSIEFMIKSYSGGKFTPYLTSLSPGQQVLFKGPLQKFKYQPNSFEKGLCIAGGSGITPMWQLINHSLSIPEDKTKWTLIYSNVSEADILLRKEFDALAQKYPGRLDIKYVVDKGPRGWKGETGYITADLIKKTFPKNEGENVRAFVCGPPGQMKAISGEKDGMKQGELSGALKDLGYTSNEVFKY